MAARGAAMIALRSGVVVIAKKRHWWLEGQSWSHKGATLVAQRVAAKGGYETKKRENEEEEKGRRSQ